VAPAHGIHPAAPEVTEWEFRSISATEWPVISEAPVNARFAWEKIA